MREKLFYILLPLIFYHGTFSYAGIIKGTVKDQSGQHLAGVSVYLQGTTSGAITDSEGFYIIKGISPGKYTMQATSVGYHNKSIDISITREELLVVNFNLEEKISELGEIVVKGKTEAQEISAKPVTITSLDAIQLRGQSLGVTEVLKRSTGVLVRRSGGLGSDAQVNLNGLTGNAVRIYYDGMPLEYMAGGIEINNLPVNLIDRIDVYKGVMPISVGTDALGGGVNIIPRQTFSDYFEASYELGSFNTHRVSLMGLKSMKDGMFLGINSFFNYSDNDYLMRNIPNQSIDVYENIYGRLDTAITVDEVDARRFNDQHVSAFAEAQIGFHDKPWASYFMFSSAYSFRFDEVQHGRRVIKRPGAETNTQLSSFIHRLKYKYRLFNGLALDYHGILSFTKQVVDDSTSNLYDWNGNILPIINNRGAEILSRPSGRVGYTLATTHRAGLNYQLNEAINFALSDFFSFSRIDGRDPYGIRLKQGENLVDPNTIPSFFRKNILGAEISSLWLNQALSLVGFYKHYHYRAESIDIMQERADRVLTRMNQNSNHGYGLALKYSFSPNLFLRSNYEQTIRIPTENEIYGNFLTIMPNYNIQPERSNNFNVGFFTKFDWLQDRFLSLDINGFLRHQKNLIRLDVSGDGEVAQFINENEAASMGAEINLETSPIKSLRVSTNFTYQQVTLTKANQGQDITFAGVQIPNIPDLFFNSSVQYNFESVLKPEDEIQLFWNYFYVDQFSITYVLDESRANPDNLVPAQNQHDFGISYLPSRRGLQFSLMINNISNAQLFDNFRVPRPGRNISFKINYSI